MAFLSGLSLWPFSLASLYALTNPINNTRIPVTQAGIPVTEFWLPVTSTTPCARLRRPTVMGSRGLDGCPCRIVCFLDTDMSVEAVGDAAKAILRS